MLRSLPVPLVLLGCFALAARADGPAPAPAPAPLLADPGFTEWTQDGAPARWRLEEGARSGDGPASSVTRGAEGGVRLAGDGATRRWSLLSQEVALREGATYRLAFEARALGLKLEAGQNDNRYVGVRFATPAPAAPAAPTVPSAASARPTFRTDAVLRDTWTPGEIVFRATASRADVVLFLSRTGALEARALVLEELAAAASFDVLARHLTRYYSYFAAKGIEPAALLAKHRDAFPADGEPGAFAEAAKRMLGDLQDLHVTVRLSDGRIFPTYFGDAPRNYDYRAVAARLKGMKQIGRIGLAGTLDDDLGYLAVTSLLGTDAQHAELAAALDGLLDKPGLVLDLRANVGGDEARALALAARLADAPHVYARRLVRSGPAPRDFSEPVLAWVRPREGQAYRKPIVVLIGRGCVSSGEGFAKMMAALPHAVLLGQPTRGASGNPAPVEMPNGVNVWFSRWVDELPDGTPTEGVGIPPTVPVSHVGTGDPTFEAGVAKLRELLKK